MVCLSDMRDKVYLDGDGVVCAALDSGIIGYQGHQAPMHSAYARHNASRRHLLSSWCGVSTNLVERRLPRGCITDTCIVNMLKSWHASFWATDIV